MTETMVLWAIIGTSYALVLLAGFIIGLTANFHDMWRKPVLYRVKK